MKKLLPFLLLSVAVMAAHANENYQYFTDAQNIAGPTGNIDTPSTQVLDRSQWSFGLHRFIVGLSYGLLPHLEAGINFNLKEMSPLFPLDEDNLARKGKEISFHSKYRLLRDGEHPLDVSLGQRRGRFYLLAGKYFEQFWGVRLEGGLAWEERTLTTFYALTQTGSSYQFLFDFDQSADHYNTGLRFLISPEMKLDFFFLDVTHMQNMMFDNFMFGITVAG